MSAVSNAMQVSGLRGSRVDAATLLRGSPIAHVQIHQYRRLLNRLTPKPLRPRIPENDSCYLCRGGDRSLFDLQLLAQTSSTVESVLDMREFVQLI